MRRGTEALSSTTNTPKALLSSLHIYIYRNGFMVAVRKWNFFNKLRFYILLEIVKDFYQIYTVIYVTN